MSVQYGGDKITFADGSSTSSGYTFRNRIINGAMMVDQRNAGASVSNLSGALTWSVDRWRVNCSAASKFTMQQNAGSVTPPTGFTKYLGLTSSSAYSSGTTDYFYLGQAIEGLNCGDLAWGTANAKTVTLSFWARASVIGTYGGLILNSGGDSNYPYTFTITSANTWQYVTITIPGPTFGSWATDNSTGIEVRFDLGTGSTYTTGTAGVWSATNYYAPGTVKLVATSGGTLYITGLQFEVGSSATTFEYRDFGRELKLCQRYYETSYAIGTPVGADLAPASFRGVCNATYASSNYFGSVVFKEYKRGEPTVTFYTSTTSGSLAGYTTGGASTVTATAQNASQFGCSGVISSVTNLQFVQGNWTAYAEL
jgi:hypothetical protein